MHRIIVPTLLMALLGVLITPFESSAQIRPAKKKQAALAPPAPTAEAPIRRKIAKVVEEQFVVRSYSIARLKRQPIDRPLPGIERFGFNVPAAKWGDEEFIEAIQSTIAPDTWEENGGVATIEILRDTLIVGQFVSNHAVIEQLLKALDAGERKPLTIRVDWLFLSKAQHASLLIASLTKTDRPADDDAKAKDLKEMTNVVGGPAYDPATLSKLIETAPGVHGQVACYDNQTVSIRAGDQILTPFEATPVVGPGGSKGYDVSLDFRQEGAAIQLTPRLQGEVVHVDVHSFVALESQDRKPISVSLDGNQTAQLPVVTRNVTRTTGSARMGVPYLVSATTVNPRTEAGDQRVLCLIVTVEGR